MEALSLSIDMDGILVNLLDTWFSEVNKKLGTNYTYTTKTITDWHLDSLIPKEHRGVLWSTINADHFMRGLPPIEGAVKALSRIKQEGIPIVIVTSSMQQSKTMVYDKIKWLKKNMPFLGNPPDFLIVTRAKYLTINPQAHYNILIDDKSENLEEAITLGMYDLAIGLRYEHNKHLEGKDGRIFLFDTWEDMTEFIIDANSMFKIEKNN